jgi:LmbE family N-acetylglucosaminyl deacetylase
VVCLTRGEASTLGAVDSLGDRREQELREAAGTLGIADIALFDFPDGALDHSDQGQLEAIVDRHVRGADLVVVFEPGGVTGHPDHRAATRVAERIAGRHHIAVLEWGVAPAVATSLCEELGAPFAALDSGPGKVLEVTVDRARQRAAIACHGSQATDNPVLARRLQLQGDRERLRYRPAVNDDRRRA